MFTYPDLEVAIHLELKNLKGFTQADANTAMQAPLTTVNLLMPDYPLDRVRLQALASIAEIVKCICETDKHPDRSLFVAEETVTQNRAGVPLQVSLGPYGSVRDATTGQQLGRNTMSALNRLLDPDLAAVYDATIHAYYCIQGNRIYFVCPSGSAVYERFEWARPAMSVFNWTAGDASSKTDAPLPNDYFNLAISGAVRTLAAKTDPGLAQAHDANWLNGLSMIYSGKPYKPVAYPAMPKQ